MILLAEGVTVRYRLSAIRRVMGGALPWTVFLPYAETVPDGGRQG